MFGSFREREKERESEKMLVRALTALELHWYIAIF